MTIATLSATSSLSDQLVSWLAERAAQAAGQGFIVGHRAIAQALQCSPGHVPALMRKLEEQGRIMRERVGKYVKTFVTDQTDRSESLAQQLQFDFEGLPPAPSAEYDPIKTANSNTDRSVEKTDQSEPVLRYRSCMQQQHTCASPKQLTTEHQTASYGTPPPNINPSLWQRMHQATQGYSVSQFDTDIKAVMSRGYAALNAVRIVVRARLNGEAIYSAEELAAQYQEYAHVEPSTQPTQPTSTPEYRGRTRRPAARSGYGLAADGKPRRVDAANPGTLRDDEIPHQCRPGYQYTEEEREFLRSCGHDV
jgi:hypothetical protein